MAEVRRDTLKIELDRAKRIAQERERMETVEKALVTPDWNRQQDTVE